MKMIALIILLLSLLQPLACFAHPCDSCLGNTDTENTSDKTEKQTHHHDSDNCDSTVCCAVYIELHSDSTPNYAPLVSIIITPEWHQKLQEVVFPIFVPPQSPA